LVSFCSLIRASPLVNFVVLLTVPEIVRYNRNAIISVATVIPELLRAYPPWATRISVWREGTLQFADEVRGLLRGRAQPERGQHTNMCVRFGAVAS
jgi:hypothetical protein